MSFLTIAVIAESTTMTRRYTAAASSEGFADPQSWAWRHAWQLAAQPGWAAAWESAVASGIPDPGADPGVITDGMILSAVQSIGDDAEGATP